ncbi:MAG: hydantoinase B/oxoprolinase family protein [Rhodospirillales bacterium]|nr:hydantoinase B/oxoprolinase family protein [Rhodospirillales bacterium]MDP7624611.1 hydantoinase B/oxoprolinase family protein [Rhodospirillales bacterium]|tara:strand:- start:1472 stop:3415 length:1944 start_codon:yes stop_codon:yes gene_type:complete
MAGKTEINVKEKLSNIEGLQMDLITFEVLRNAFVAACYEASTTIERIAYHPIIGMGRDRSNALLTEDARLVAHGHTDAAAHYASFEPSVQELFKDIPKDTMNEGDTYIFSDPYRTGSHVNDVRMIRPIFYEGKIVAFSCTVIHWADMGGPMPGTFNPEATTCYAEGIRIPPIRLFKNNELDEELFSLIEINIRGAIERRADMKAQFEAARLIDRRVVELCEKYGVETLFQAFEEQFNYSERMMLTELESLPDGEWEFEDFGDQDVMAEGKPPIRVHCKLTKVGSKLSFDWTDSDPQPKASWGGSRATLIGGNYLGFMICFPQLFPLNHGIIRNLEIVSKPGTCVDVVFPAPTTGYCSGAFDKIEAVTIACLAGVMAKDQPWRVYPAAVSLTNLCMGGYNPRTKKDFIQYTWAVGGENARTFKDGKSLIFMRFCNARTIPQELEERWFPVIFDRYEARPDSCGHGFRRGGFGLIRELVIQTDIVMTIHGDREIHTPFGISGGLNGGGSTLIINKGTPDEFDAGMYATGVKLKKGDKIFYGSSGGGGFGDPLDREPELVLDDVIDEWLTIEAAEEYYGVVIEEIDAEAADYRINEEKTKKAQAKLRKKGFKEGTGAFEINVLGKDIKPERIPSEEEVRSHLAISRPPGW